MSFDADAAGVTEACIVAICARSPSWRPGDLCDYIDATLTESGIDVTALAIRNGKDPGELIGEWRTW